MLEAAIELGYALLHALLQFTHYNIAAYISVVACGQLFGWLVSSL